MLENKVDNPPEPSHEVVVVQGGEAEDSVVADDLDEMLKARLPLFSSQLKASYLTYRATGFSVREAAHLAQVTTRTVHKWRREDPVFMDWEQNRLQFLRTHVAGDVLRAEFTRNLRLAFVRDMRVLKKAVFNFEGMDEREYQYLLKIRGLYTPQDLLALVKAIGEGDGETSGLKPGEYRQTLTVTVEGRDVDSEEAQKAAAKALLDKFVATGKYRGEDEGLVIEGHVAGGNGSSD